MSRVLAAFLLIAVPALSQSLCFAENDTPNFNNAVSMGGPNLLLAIKITPTQVIQATALEIFTGEGTGTNTLGLWSHDPVLNLPIADLGTGSFAMTSVNSWQGATLPAPVTLNAGTTYWFVWGPINGSQAAVDVQMPTLGQEYRGSFNGGASWNGPFMFNDRHWKIRIYGTCAAPGCQGIEITSATGILPPPLLVAPTGAVTSSLSLPSAATTATQIRIRVASDLPVQPYVLAASPSLLPAPIGVPAPLSGFVAINPIDPGFLIVLDGFLNPAVATTDALGVGELAFTPAVPLPPGFNVFLQGIVLCQNGIITLTDTAALSIQ